MLGYYAASCGNCSPPFLYNVSRRKSLHRDVIMKVVAFTADRVEREGWIERTLGVSSSEADGKTYGIK